MPPRTVSVLILGCLINIIDSYTDIPPQPLENERLAVEDLKESDNKLNEWYDINKTQFIESGSSLIRFGSVSPEFKQKFKTNFNSDASPTDETVVFKYFNLDEFSLSDLMLELEIQNAMNSAYKQHIPRIYHWFKERNMAIFAMESAGKEIQFATHSVTENGQIITTQIKVSGDSYLEAKNRVCSLLKQMLPVLKYMNEKGIHHRDLRMDNFLVDAGVWKMIDFGSAQLMQNISIDTFEMAIKYTSPEILTALASHFGNTNDKVLKRRIFELIQKDPITNDLPGLIVSALKVYLLTVEYEDKRLFKKIYNVFEPYAFMSGEDLSCIHGISMNEELILSIIRDKNLRELFAKWLPKWSDEDAVIDDYDKYKHIELFEDDWIRGCSQI